ncbi:hypothetical protein AXF42_Ash019229 [Apostasia shenzhenica]|uniref:DUF7906 domain-containing protein n=1 Tax=Apostasia shenzhenica TaxID=1088818 RepID=A0A2I0A317_9ASPA|nr:hypothetical protein AXF42_Ash019229 [Apostasia shenzhenica]
MGSILRVALIFSSLYLLSTGESAPQPFRRDPGHPHWHHSAFHDVQESVRSDVRRMLHTRAEVPFQVPLEVNVVLVGFNGDGGYRYQLDARKLKDFLKTSFPTHRPSCFETGEPIDIEHHIIYNAISAGQPELIALEMALKDAMLPAGAARESDFGRELPLFEVEATIVEPVRIDPRNKETHLESLMYGRIDKLTEEQLKNQEGDYIYRYRYNGGGASQVWLSSGRYVVIDLSAGPCTYGKIETEEGSVSYKTMPRLSNLIFSRGSNTRTVSSTNELLMGELGALISTTIEHVIAPDIRFLSMYFIMVDVKKLVHSGQEVILFGGSYALHRHEKLAIAVSKAMRGHSLQETKKDGRFHVHTRTYLDGAILKEEMERSADVLAAGLLEVSDPSLSSKFYFRQHWMDESDDVQDSIIKHKPLWESYYPKYRKDKRKTGKKKQENLYKTYGTRVVPVFVLSMAGVNADLLMDDESLVWTSKDVVIVLQHDNKEIPLSYVSETTKQHLFPSLVQRHILAGLASAVGGLSAPYERASHVHERPIVNWLWATGCHPYGPFSNTSKVSQMLQDVALRSSIYANVDAALHRIRDTSEAIQSFASEHLKTPLGEPVKGKEKKSATELWVEKFYKKITNLPEPFPHELVDRLEQYLDKIEEQLVDLSALLYDHQLEDAYQNSSDIFQSTIFTQQYVERVLLSEKDQMRCCRIEYGFPVRSSQAFVYGGILLAGFVVYFIVIFFSSPVR